MLYFIAMRVLVIKEDGIKFLLKFLQAINEFNLLKWNKPDKDLVNLSLTYISEVITVPVEILYNYLLFLFVGTVNTFTLYNGM